MAENEPTTTPAAPTSAGQQPTMPTTPTNDTLTNQPTPPAPPSAPTGEPPTTPQEQPPEIRNPEAYRASQEAAKYRNDLKAAQARLAEFEAAQKAAEEAQLSELEKAQRRLAEYQQKEAQQTLEIQQRVTQWATRAEAARMGLNPDLAAKIIDYAAIEFDESGNPQNVGDLLGQAIQQFGLNPQPATAQQPTAPAAQQVGMTNPTRQNGPITINATQYSDPAFRKQFIADYGEDILSAMNKGKVKIV